jgi:hypothetical protein
VRSVLPLPRRVGQALAALLALPMAACGGSGAALPPTPAQVAVQPGDLPATMHRCPNSGPMDVYLRDLEARNPYASTILRGSWTDLQDAGATTAVLVQYAADPAACADEPGAGPGPNAATFVARFPDAQSAAAAFRKGALGFPTPPDGEQAPGLSQGDATHLSPTAWVLQRSVRGRFLYVAYWQRAAFTIMFVAADLDSQVAHQAAMAASRRAG